MNEHTQKSLAKIFIIILVIALGYFLYNTVFGAVTFNVPGLTGTTLNTSQSGKLRNGLTHMWSFDTSDMDITSYSQTFSTSTIATVGADVGGGNQAWVTPTNVTLDDNITASTDIAAETSNYVSGTSFGYVLSTSVDVLGIEVIYERSAESASLVDARGLYLTDASGGTTTVNHADVGTFWPTGAEVKTFGGLEDTWGKQWKTSDINGASFGPILSIGKAANPARMGYLDYFKTVIYYETPIVATSTDLAGSVDGRLNGPIPESGKIGQGLIFDGVNDLIEFDSTVSFKTISFWVKPEVTYAGLINIISNTYQSIDVIANGIRATNFDLASTTIYVDGKEGITVSQNWHHVVLTNTDSISATDFQIGAIATTTIPNYFQGKIDNVRTYDRVLSAHEIQRLYNMGGTLHLNTRQTGRIDEGLLANFSFDGGDIRWNNFPTSTAFGRAPETSESKSGDGIIGYPGTIMKGVLHDGSYFYTWNLGNFGIQKRFVSSGDLDLSFGTAGVAYSTTGGITSVAQDADYLYLAGYQDGAPVFDYRIEKRYKNDGSKVLSFGIDGVAELSADSRQSSKIIIDDTYLYVTGIDDNIEAYLEKRTLSDGVLDSDFGSGGVVAPGAGTYYYHDLVLDGIYMYLLMSSANPYDWMIEKRLISDGSLCTAVVCGVEFGISGVVTSDVSSNITDNIYKDGEYLYIYGEFNRIEKRLASSGALDTSFGTGGVIDLLYPGLSGYSSEASVEDAIFLYIFGTDNSSTTAGWVMQRRFKTDGSIDWLYGDKGLVRSDAVTNWFYSSNAIDLTSFLMIGTDDSSNTYITKQLKSDGSLDTTFGTTSFDGYDATFVGPIPTAGKTGQALSFDGIDDYVDAGNISSQTPSANPIKSIAFWMKADDITSRGIINIDNTDLIEIDASSNVIATSFLASTVYIDTSSASPVITSDWHHIVINDTTGVNPTNFQIGTEGVTFFDGILDEVRIYNRILTQRDINRLYRMGKR